ncbi:S8 family serine peptidase [Aliikangiella coralliicola]|uniref:S8 family serine peptidase n=1 Tax=Aliikangiella coralliicola TaxID=2592383 RepID=A0A545TW42_9GAMM|nr:S8 family serine peptidase [Aliikangiella coralliicola]TQV81443.1 S8 family serine peptidase [Aliikangiella coralliicola]
MTQKKQQTPLKFNRVAIALGCALAITGTVSNISAETLNRNSTDAQQQQRFIVKLKDQSVAAATQSSTSSTQAYDAKVRLFESTAAMVNTQVIRSLDSVNAMAVMLDADQKTALSRNPNVEYVEIDPKRYLMAETTPYGITMVQAPQVSDSKTSNRKVCIMDTGYTLNHPDLPSSGITGDDGHGSNDTGNWYQDGHGHGTHVAGTIAALGGNGQGVVGVNPSGNLGLHIVKVFDDSGSWAYGSDLVAAINQCTAAGANVISMSLGGSNSSNAERSAFNSANSRGVLSIAAAGNAGNSSLSYPASYDSVVSVAAVDSAGNKASFSQYNSQVEISGPGVNTNSTWNNNGYKSISGTSMATPHVSGVAALVWSHYPSCSNQQVRDAMNQTAEDKGSPGRDTSYGYGIVKAKAALDRLASVCGDGENVAPNANFSVAVNGNTASFTDSSTDDKGVTSHSWTFGDGSSSSDENPVHSYSTDGHYQVTLTVSDAEGLTDSHTDTVTIGSTPPPPGCDGLEAWSATKSYKAGDKVSYNNYEYTATWWSTGAQPDIFSNVWRKGDKCSGSGENQPPRASFSYSTNQLSVTFSDSSTDDNGIATYAWDFGDGNSSSQANPSHTYAASGSYQVTLTVTDAGNLRDSSTQTVTVSEVVDGCDGLAAWESSKVYHSGDEVSYNGNKYRANWWSRNDNPEQNSGPWQVWTKLGPCR